MVGNQKVGPVRRALVLATVVVPLTAVAYVVYLLIRYHR
tara:strand:- start:18779 stop:18895 length:117 start_codon:yes stop_codon:yes gene_type:complete